MESGPSEPASETMNRCQLCSGFSGSHIWLASPQPVPSSTAGHHGAVGPPTREGVGRQVVREPEEIIWILGGLTLWLSFVSLCICRLSLARMSALLQPQGL